LLVIALVCLIQAILTEYQHACYERYGYNCVGMSRDCEAFFEGLGINTEVRWGIKPDAEAGHCWIALETVFGWVEFESTALQFASISEHYPEVSSDDGWFCNGTHRYKQPMRPMPAE